MEGVKIPKNLTSWFKDGPYKQSCQFQKDVYPTMSRLSHTVTNAFTMDFLLVVFLSGEKILVDRNYQKGINRIKLYHEHNM